MTDAKLVDRYSITNRFPSASQKADVVVIGAGPSGVAAAIAAAKGGASVLLVDENPVSASLMGLDTPLYFGGLSPVARDAGAASPGCTSAARSAARRTAAACPAVSGSCRCRLASGSVPATRWR